MEIMELSASVDHEAETEELPTVMHCADCGKLIESGEFGHDRETGSFVCYACCGYRDKGYMIEEGKTILYLDMPDAPTFGRKSRGCIDVKSCRIINWPGSLEFKVLNIREGNHNIAGVRYDAWFVGPDGFVWHGTQYGNWTMVIHCKRTRERWDRG